MKNHGSQDYFITTGEPWYYGRVIFSDDYLFENLADRSNMERLEEEKTSKHGLVQQLPTVRPEYGIISTMKYTGLKLADARDLQMIYRICKFPFNLVKQINGAIALQCDTIPFYEVKLPFYDEFTLYEYAVFMKELETQHTQIFNGIYKNDMSIEEQKQLTIKEDVNIYPFEGFRFSWIR
jgi:hypothetical protein